jgi:hypothetical protein
VRRFRYGDATRVVSEALDYIGRSWRVVSLDDAATEAVGVAPGLRISSRLLARAKRAGQRVVKVLVPVGKVTAVVSIAGIVAVFVWTAHRGDLEALISSLPGGRGRPTDSAEALLVWVLGGVLVVEFALLVGSLILMLAAIPFIPVWVMLGGVGRDIRRAESSKWRAIHTEADVDAVASSIASGSVEVLAPRLTVLSVDSAVWQPAVLGLARQSAAVIIDVSQVTDHVLWEVEEMNRRMDTRTVFVIHRDRLHELAGPHSGGSHRLSRLLDGREVLAYSPTFLGRLRFQRALFGQLESTRLPEKLTWRRVVRMLFTVAGNVCFAGAVRAALVMLAEL